MRPGKVSLVGAGPGDPGLVTVKGLRCIEAAEVVIYDRLVDPRLLAHAPSHAELIDAGKVPGEGGKRQAEINALMLTKAGEGKRVVRLKGGDPFVFGRGGEEAEVLHKAGVAFDVVPGITSATAAPAYAGIPLTHRGLASSFTVVTGSEAADGPGPAVAWDKLAEADGTLVVLMGWESLDSIAKTLVQFGRSPDTPIALVQWGTEPYQRTVVGTLSDIVGKAEQAGLAPPVVAVIGKVVLRRAEMRWFDNRPLFGKRVLVTRTRSQAGALSDLLSDRGAQPIELPTIEIRALDDYSDLDGALGRLTSFDWVIFTSANSVDAVFDRLGALRFDCRAFGSTRVAAIGSATAESLREHGIVADFVPETFVSDAIVGGLKDRELGGSRVLLPRADRAPQALSQDLSTIGAVVEEVTAYRTVPPEESGKLIVDVLSDGIEIATFTSSSTVTSLVRILDGSLDRLSQVTVACIGPVTAATARELGLRVDIVAREHTVAGLLDALEAHFAEEDSSHG